MRAVKVRGAVGGVERARRRMDVGHGCAPVRRLHHALDRGKVGECLKPSWAKPEYNTFNLLSSKLLVTFLNSASRPHQRWKRTLRISAAFCSGFYDVPIYLAGLFKVI
jgi:hypothetical protein